MTGVEDPFTGEFTVERVLDVPVGPAQEVADADVAARLALLAAVAGSTAPQTVRITRPAATAAFSRRDALLPGFATAAGRARDRGFAPVVRPVGGRLAPYHPGCLVVDVVGRAEDVRTGAIPRFEAFAQGLAEEFRAGGIDARVGEIPGEYCSGRHSINVAGAYKIVGTAQRQVRGGFLVSAVVVVRDPEPLADVVGATYAALGLPVDPATVGSLDRARPGLQPADAVELLLAACRRFLTLDETPAGGPSAGEASSQPGARELGGEVLATS
ncbi:biotin/lipoate A/B protein ligase family protein [Kineococcus gynurae]|uniref:Biotin/lipoate A/B protein ligase family protein n=1 Tax=Kineococcus gynurae TaxID=452979 RepID=A0ABV5LP77_9ACTN